MDKAPPTAFRFKRLSFAGVSICIIFTTLTPTNRADKLTTDTQYAYP
ncbi:MAG: hypothetical protein IJ143_09260 [Neisseriaceae bacterium]|nr:hypothetical protein [Neisseriaceae bacterium]